MASALVAVDAVNDTIAALEGPATSASAAVRLLREHLAVVRHKVEAVATDAEDRGAAAALRSSSVRLERMVRLLERAEDGTRRAAGYDAGTLRTSLVLQLRAHAELERLVLSQLDERLTAERTDGPPSAGRPARSAAGDSRRATGPRARRWRHRLRALRKVVSRASDRS